MPALKPSKDTTKKRPFSGTTTKAVLPLFSWSFLEREKKSSGKSVFVLSRVRKWEEPTLFLTIKTWNHVLRIAWLGM